MVKWKNLSYSESTWEHESSLPEYLHKINDFKQFNRALDKESRAIQMRNNAIHKTLLEMDSPQRKKVKPSHHQLLEMKNRLYHYDVATKKQPL
jgi:chromodomain-helicase-DNA-binding protein 7